MCSPSRSSTEIRCGGRGWSASMRSGQCSVLRMRSGPGHPGESGRSGWLPARHGAPTSCDSSRRLIDRSRRRGRGSWPGSSEKVWTSPPAACFGSACPAEGEAGLPWSTYHRWSERWTHSPPENDELYFLPILARDSVARIRSSRPPAPPSCETGRRPRYMVTSAPNEEPWPATRLANSSRA
jgi:hypothetical protein